MTSRLSPAIRHVVLRAARTVTTGTAIGGLVVTGIALEPGATLPYALR